MVCVKGQAKIGEEVSFSLHLPVGFVDGVEEIHEDYENVDVSSIAVVPWMALLRPRFACADCDAIVDRLYDICRKLDIWSVLSFD
jgi:hypothetical protein